ncbi:hypothetical protein ABMC88_09120 [Sulfitobacter sp. HNIBRBA2951]|uniref:hypothetical protein n=1 Tax=Sulfitobacter aquimarinus TaxID=3158557 RepID=UPI0032DF77E7
MAALGEQVYQICGPLLDTLDSQNGRRAQCKIVTLLGYRRHIRFSYHGWQDEKMDIKVALRVVQVISLLIGVTVFVTGKDFIGDINFDDIEDVFLFLAEVFFALFKLLVTYVAVVLSIALTIPVVAMDLIYNFFISSGSWDTIFLLGDMWNLSWNVIVVDWFWEKTQGLHLLGAFLLTTPIGFFIDTAAHET